MKKPFFFQKTLFIETIEAIIKQVEYDYDVSDKLSEALEADIEPHNNHFITNQLLKILHTQFPPDGHDCPIEMFMSNSISGVDSETEIFKDKNGNEIDISSASILYDYLTSLSY